jgi:ArsR family transcriptional regulator
VFTGRSSETRLAPGQFDRIAKALADPRRFALFEAIAAGGQDCPNQRLCHDFPVSKATVSHHLKELTQAGLVEAEKEGQFVTYRARRDVESCMTVRYLCREAPQQ